jgi:hypothetical protein
MPLERDNDAERLARIELLLEQNRLARDDARKRATRPLRPSHGAVRPANVTLDDSLAGHESVHIGLRQKAS